ncbi:hypothetical protein ACP70R_005781 [Stipagrostis hirtigluma subsp. patula]
MGSTTTSPATVQQIRCAQRADGPAAVLAVGTANPAKCVLQDEYPEFYFRVTKSEHLTHLKDKLKQICQKTGVQKRFFHHTEDLLNVHPEFIDHTSPSLDARLDIVSKAIPELAASAAKKAIAEWGKAATDITHLVVTTNSGAHVPGVDFHLIPLLGLRPSVRRTMLYHNGCFAGSAAMRIAKDLAENNHGARVLVVCAELTVMLFRGPKEGCIQTLIDQALFGDGAGAVIVGADPMAPIEHPLFEMVLASQTVVPNSADALYMQLTAAGINGFTHEHNLGAIIGDNVEPFLLDMIGALGITAKWNDLFWVVHPGASPILDQIEVALQLEPEKLAASRHVLSEYGNMFGASVIFVLDELRRRREDGEKIPEWGVMMAVGPGLTLEMMVLHSCTGKDAGTTEGKQAPAEKVVTD